jgi:hypothetical protein
MAETPLSKATVEAIFIKQGVPGWVGWGTYGAESSYGRASNSGHGFGLIEANYESLGAPNSNPRHNAELSAKVYAREIKQTGGLAAAISNYSGNSYTIEHVRQLGGASRTATGAGENLVNEGPIPENVEGAIVHAPKTIGHALTHNPLTDIVGFVAKLFDPSVWLRAGKAIAGFLLMAFGAITLMKVLVGIEIPTPGVRATKSLFSGLTA